MSEFGSISPNELSILAQVVAIALASGKSADDLNVLGNFIVAVGGILLTMAAQMQVLQSEQDKIKQINNIKDQIEQLKKDLQNLCNS